MRNVYILAYKGRSFLDRVIRWWEWGDYSHVMFCPTLKKPIFDSVIYEISGMPLFKPKLHRARKGYLKDLHPNYKKENIDVYKIGITITKYYALVEWFDAQIRAKVRYDYLSYFGFAFHQKEFDKPKKHVCSTFIFEGFKQIGIMLQNAPTYKITPALLTMSPLLKKVNRKL